MNLIEENYSDIRNLNNIWGNKFSEKRINFLDKAGTVKFLNSGYKCITKYFPSNIASVLEVGVGSARFLTKWKESNPNCICYGVDKSSDVIEYLQKEDRTHNIKLSIGDALHLPFPQNFIDTIFSEGLLEHYLPKHQLKILTEMGKVATQSVIVTVPNYYCPSLRLAMLYTDTKGNKCNWRYGYEKPMKYSELVALFKKAGFSKVKRVGGWCPWYGLKFYKWDTQSRKKILPWYISILLGIRFILETITSLIDPIFGNVFSFYFGYEITVIGKK